MIRSVLVLTFMIFLACSEVKRTELEEYYSIERLIDSQVNYHSKNNSFLVKKAIIDQDTAEVRNNLDSLGWVNEFEIIRQLDIDKPAFMGRYSKEEYDDTHSNLKVTSYNAKEKDMKVRQVEVYYLNSFENIKIIKARSHEKNALFESSLKVEMGLDMIKNELIIENYSIEGFQKMLSKGKVSFSIEGSISANSK